MGIGIFVVLNVKFKVHSLICLLLVGLFLAFAEGMPIADILPTVQKGFGDIFGSIGIVVLFGSITK